MALQSIKGGAWVPNRPPQLSAALSFAAIQLDTTDEKLAFVVQSPPRPIDPVTGNPFKIAKIGFSVTANSGSNSYDIRLESVDAASGHPTGSLWSAGTNVVQSLGLNWVSAPLGTQADVPIGAFIAIVIARQSGGAHFATVNSGSSAQEFPYTCHYNGGTWTKLQNGPVCALEFADGSYQVIQGAWPIKAVANTSFNSSGVNQRGLRVKLPFPAQAVGAWVWADLDGDATLKLYNNVNPNSPAELASVTLDKDYRYGVTYGRQVYYFNNPVSLYQNAEYFLTLNPSSGTSVILNEVEVHAAALLDAMDGGRELHLVTRSTSGAFDVTATTKRPMMGLILDQFPGTLGYFDVTTFGAKGDGSNNDTPWIQAAITAATSAGAGSTVFVPQGTYLCQGLNLNSPGLRIIGDGTLKLITPSTAACVLEVSSDYCEVSGIRIDGNSAGSHSGAGHGLLVTGNYCHVNDVYAKNTKANAATATFKVSGQHTLCEGCRSEDAGGDAFSDTGDYNRFQDCSGKNWGNVGFHRHVTDLRERLDLDGCYFESGNASDATNCILIDGDSGKQTAMVAIRNTVVNWGDVDPDGTPSLAKFARVEWLILDNCLFKHKQALVDVEIGSNVKRAHIDHTFLSRKMKCAALETDAIVLLMDTLIGSQDLFAAPNTQPDVAIEGVGGAQLILRSCHFIGYTTAAIDVPFNLDTTGTFVHLEASDSEFQGLNNSTPTYDVRVSGSGAINGTRKLLWLNVSRSNFGAGGLAQPIAAADLHILFKTRDWSKKVLEWPTDPLYLSGITWQNGDTVMNTAPTSGGKIGWVKTPTGWKTFGPIS